MGSLIAELEEEPLEHHKIIGLGHQEIQEEQELVLNRQSYFAILLIEKLFGTMDPYHKDGKFHQQLDSFISLTY
jgi:hypothetical protein